MCGRMSEARREQIRANSITPELLESGSRRCERTRYGSPPGGLRQAHLEGFDLHANAVRAGPDERRLEAIVTEKNLAAAVRNPVPRLLDGRRADVVGIPKAPSERSPK